MHKLNPHVIKAEYAVRGELALRAEELRAQLENGQSALPFSRIVNCNIGNPQQLGQPPISFFRRVLALVECPQLLESTEVPRDVRERARGLLRMVGSTTGSYSHSKGVRGIRGEVAAFLAERDGVPADIEDIFLTNGASEGISRVLTLFAKGPQVGVLLPIPQYPLYAATVTLLDATIVPYYLDEQSGWALKLADLEAAIAKATVKPSILCVINPGNPTGNCFDADSIRDIFRCALKHDLILLFDEVYQENWYTSGSKFVSSRSVYASDPAFKALHLFSFHSCSKGLLGECGKRGGFLHYEGHSAEIRDQLYKLASISLCPNMQGQLLVSLLVNPPREGDESYSEYSSETQEIYHSLKRRAQKLHSAFNSMHGVSCQPAQGAMYLFPKYCFPEKAMVAANNEGKAADTFYALRMLDETGVCMVPGSGFGQAVGTFHIRSTFLPSEPELDEFVGRISAFHQKFIDEYK